MATQMTSARRGVATDEMKQIAKDEDVTLDWLIPKIASGSIIIPSNNVRKEKIHNVAIGKGTKTKVNVNIGTVPNVIGAASNKDRLILPTSPPSLRSIIVSA